MLKIGQNRGQKEEVQYACLFSALRKYGNSKKNKTEKWCENTELFRDSLIKNAYDIICKDTTFQKKIEDFGVKVTREDIDFYQDNCSGNLCVPILFLKIGRE